MRRRPAALSAPLVLKKYEGRSGSQQSGRKSCETGIDHPRERNRILGIADALRRRRGYGRTGLPLALLDQGCRAVWEFSGARLAPDMVD